MRTNTPLDVSAGAVDRESPRVKHRPAATLTPLALRARDAAKCLGISARKLWSLTNAGKIPHVRIGRAITYPVAALEKWLSTSAKGGK